MNPKRKELLKSRGWLGSKVSHSSEFHCDLNKSRVKGMSTAPHERSMSDEIQKTRQYRTHRERGSARHDAVRRQDEHGQSWSGRHNADGEGSAGQGNQPYRHGGRVQLWR